MVELEIHFGGAFFFKYFITQFLICVRGRMKLLLSFKALKSSPSFQKFGFIKQVDKG